MYVGKPLPRPEDFRFLTGRGKYVDDIKLPRCASAGFLRSPHAHASIRAIDTAAARHAPGVVAVITAEDLEGVVAPLPTRRETEAQELRPPVHPILARGKVRPMFHDGNVTAEPAHGLRKFEPDIATPEH